MGTSPVNGDTNIPTNAVIVLEFNEPLSTLSTSAIQISAGGQPVAGSFALSDANRQITFMPAAHLVASTFYTVIVGGVVTDLGNNLIDNPGSFTFQTGAAIDAARATVVSVSPVDGAINVPTKR